jgi:hypothetical protein
MKRAQFTMPILHHLFLVIGLDVSVMRWMEGNKNGHGLAQAQQRNHSANKGENGSKIMATWNPGML